MSRPISRDSVSMGSKIRKKRGNSIGLSQIGRKFSLKSIFAVSLQVVFINKRYGKQYVERGFSGGFGSQFLRNAGDLC